ncbi:MAG: hypothetical protein IH598_07845 [Bacteroidales bacterium]|nr:hypothetical protein [Bacteroidales bacterium]
MKKNVLFISSALMLFLCISTIVLANEGRVTFLNNAQRQGQITATIRFSNGTRCNIQTNVTHPNGTTATDKANQLAQDISNQCPGVSAVAIAGTGTVQITTTGGNDMTEIDITDGTGQRKTINPSNLDDGNLRVSLDLSGTGSCSDGSAYVSLDAYEVSADIATFGKTGSQVTSEMATLLSELLQDTDIQVISINFGNETGRLVIQNLPSEFSTITFEAGGDCGIDDRVVMSKNQENAIPTLSEWGVIILLLLLLAVGMVFVYKRQTALALAGGVEEAGGTQLMLFNKQLYAKVFGFTLLAGLVFLGLTYLVAGEITAADPLGTFVSAGIIAYMIHLGILRKS